MTEDELSPGSAEKRRHDRAEVDGYVVVHAPGHEIHCRIVNLSRGGLLVRATDAANGLAPGVPVMVEVELEELGWATQAGTVVRRAGSLIAIGFSSVDAGLERVIEGEVRHAGEAARNPRVVVMDPSPQRRRRITDALRAAGANSLEAATPLEAVDLIERSRVRVAAVAVAERTRSQTDSDELVDYLEEHHPDLRVALIVDRPPHNPRSRVATLPGDEHADLHGPVRELLARRS